MARLQTSKKEIAALYSFAVDGGAVSAINLGIFIPNNAIVTGFRVKTNTAPTSGGAATISFGFTGNLVAFMVINGIAAFVAGETLSGVDLKANPLEMTATNQLVISIVTAALTAGILVASLDYVELDV